MAKKVIYTDRVMRPIAHFSHAARVGNVIHIGATAGTDEQRRLPGTLPGLVDVEAQIRRMFQNVGVVLDLLGARLEHTVRVKTYVADLRDLPRYRALYAETFGAIAPDHVVVGSAGFPLPQAAIELDLVAVVDQPVRRVPDVGVGVAGKFYCSSDAVPEGGDFETQASNALQQISARVERGGLRRSEIVYLHATLSDCRDVPAFTSALASAFPAEPPACTVVIAPLADAGAMLQLEAVAAVGGGRPVVGVERLPEHRIGSAAVLAGEELYIGGQLGDDEGGHLGPDVEGQTRAAWERVRAMLTAVGMDAASIVRTNNVLTDWRHYAAFNAGYGANVAEPYPPRATVLGGLPRRRAHVQIEAIGHRHGAEAVIVQVPDAMRSA